MASSCAERFRSLFSCVCFCVVGGKRFDNQTAPVPPNSHVSDQKPAVRQWLCPEEWEGPGSEKVGSIPTGGCLSLALLLVVCRHQSPTYHQVRGLGPGRGGAGKASWSCSLFAPRRTRRGSRQHLALDRQALVALRFKPGVIGGARRRAFVNHRQGRMRMRSAWPASGTRIFRGIGLPACIKRHSCIPKPAAMEDLGDIWILSTGFNTDG